MKTCNEYQKMILNHTSSDALVEHLNTCNDCKMFDHILNHKVETNMFTLNEAMIKKEVDRASHRAEKINKRNTYRSTVLFIVMATVLLFVLLSLINIIISYVMLYLIVISFCMPISLLVLTINKERKEVY